MKKFLIIGGIVLVVLAVGFFVVLPKIVSASSTSTTTTYKTSAAGLGDISTSVSGTGNVRAKQSTTVKWQTSGTVATLKVGLGDTVAAGDVLAELDPASVPTSVVTAQVDLEAAQKNLESVLDNSSARANAQAALVQAQIDLKTAQDNSTAMQFQRADQNTIDIYTAKLLLAKDALTKAEQNFYHVTHANLPNPNYNADYANALSQLATAREGVVTATNNLSYVEDLPNLRNIELVNAELEQAKANLLAAQKAWDLVKDGPDPAAVATAQAKVTAAQSVVNQARIIAPISGTITDVYNNPGDLVASGGSAFLIQDKSTFLVDVQISEVDITSVQVDQPAKLTFDAITENEYNGKVIKIASTGTTSNGAVNYTVTVAMSDADEYIKAGMSASVDIVVKQLTSILVVPTSALRTVNNSQVIYVLQNNVAVPLAVTLGAASDITTQILSGSLKEGDLIITNPSTVTAATTQSSGLSGLLSGLSNMFTGAAGATGGAGGPPSGGAGGPPSGFPPSGAPSGGSTGGN